MKAERHSTRMD